MCSVCSVAESQNSQHQFVQWLLSYHHNLLVFLPNYFLIKVTVTVSLTFSSMKMVPYSGQVRAVSALP